jgi:hypothetical protein
LLAVECKNHTKSREEENEKAVVIVQGQLMDPVHTCVCVYLELKKNDSAKE